jgi:hypothetical protein
MAPAEQNEASASAGFAMSLTKSSVLWPVRRGAGGRAYVLEKRLKFGAWLAIAWRRVDYSGKV